MKRFRVFAEVKSYSILPPNTHIKVKAIFNSGIMKIQINNQNAIDLIGREFSKCLSIITEIDAEEYTHLFQNVGIIQMKF